MNLWTHIGPSVIASFLASLVEFVEALTIVLAVGTVRGWRPALIGTAAGVGVLVFLVLLFGPTLQRIPLTTLQMVIGTLLLLFGIRWLRKAILRSANIIGLHDEEAIYAKETATLRQGAGKGSRLDWGAIATTFKAVVLEGIEVVFIVIAVGSTANMLIPASLGAAAAGILVVILGALLHQPLARVPENTLKFVVGVLLTAFGVFWIGEGLGLRWIGEDLSLFGLAAAFLVTAMAGVSLVRRMVPTQTNQSKGDLP